MPEERSDAAARSRVPFWAHQLAELLLGVMLLFEGARTGTHAAVVVAGVVLILFSLMTDGPLGAWSVIPRKVHRVGDVVIALLLVASPFLLGIDESIAIVLLVVAAVALLWLAWKSDFSTPVKRRWRKTAPESSQAATPPAPKPVVPSVPSARDAGRALGRLRTGGVRAAGRAVGKASAERATGQQASAERATGQQASAEPTAESPPERPGVDTGDESSPE